MTYEDPNGLIIDEYGEVVDSPDMPDDAFAVRESLQDAQRGAASGHSEGRGHPSEGQGRP